MIHLGDIQKINGAEIPPVDIITGGSPCQDLSVAGKRAGLDGERSGLFMEQIRIVKEMRDATAVDDRRMAKPRYMVWENVPGAFSSNQGKDFQAVLTEIVRIAEPDAPDVPLPEKWGGAGLLYDKLGRWSVAWRVHDAQFWGVPQRRKRIALVADFAGLSAGEILFERKGMSRDSEKSGEEGQRTTENAERRVAATITSTYGTKWNGNAGAYNGENFVIDGHQPLVFEPGAASRVGGHVYEDDVAGTVRANAGDNQQAVVYGISSYDSNAMKPDNPNSGIYEAETSRTLDLNGGNPACNQGGMVVLEGNGSRPSHKGDGYAESETMYTLNSTEHHAVAYRKTSHAKSAEDGHGWAETDINDTLNAFDSGETRTPTVIVDNKKTVYDWHRCDTRMTELGDTCNTMSASWGAGGNNMPYVLEAIGGEVAGTLDSSYYKGQGLRQGVEREYIVEIQQDVVSEDNRPTDGEQPSGQLLRTGRIQ